MRFGIACLIFAYVLSQFYRAFLAVLAPLLEQELAITKQALASASGYWFLAFAAMQLPVGLALDRFGPRRTVAVCLSVAALGAACFAQAHSAAQIQISMTMIGFGCAPILVSTYFIFARQFSPAAFASLGGLAVGVGSLGDIFGSLPLAIVVEHFGWRAAMWTVAGITALTVGLVFVAVKDPQRLGQGTSGSLWDVVLNRQIWPVLAMMFVCYAAPSALRGLWLGPYFHDVWGFSRTEIGWAGLAMGVGLVVGSLAIGPIARKAGSLKWVAFGSNAIMVLSLLALWQGWGHSASAVLVLFITVGLFGSTFPIVTGHARTFIAPEVMGRGVTFVNLCGMVSVGVAQQITGRLHQVWDDPVAPQNAYSAIFGYFFWVTLIGLAIYLFSREQKNQA